MRQGHPSPTGPFGPPTTSYDAAMQTYRWLRLRCADRTWDDALERRRGGASLAGTWGVFSGLFGIGSDELVVVEAGDRSDGAWTEAGFSVVESYDFAPTVRPTRFEPCTRPGLYVHRFFSVATADVDEIARLSEEAWTTFEDTDDYDAQPQALFAEADRSRPDGRMLLITWYDGLESWQTSRAPAPQAAENFRRRRALTTGTIAFATRLVEGVAGQDPAVEG